MPAVARIGDMHTCPLDDHEGGPVLAGASTIMLGGKPAACVGDPLECQCGGPDTILEGESTVLFGGKIVARIGDPTEHGGVIVGGCPTILIGMTPQAKGMRRAAKRGTPLAQQCGKKKKQKKKKKSGKGKGKCKVKGVKCK